MIIIAGATALYPIIIDYAFKALEEQNWSKIVLVPIFKDRKDKIVLKIFRTYLCLFKLICL